MTFYSISNEEVWKELQELRMEQLRDKGRIAVLEEAGVDREKRIRKLEFRYYAVLAAIGLSAIISALAQKALS